MGQKPTGNRKQKVASFSDDVTFFVSDSAFPRSSEEANG